MGLFDAPARQAAKGRLFPAATGLFRASGGQRDLQSRVAELETLQQQFGAPEIEQDKPGVFSRIIDVLSRPNFAIAGFAEEVFGEEPSVGRGVKRALTEIFSGVGGIEGEKRAFGEVLENLGAGTTTLADAFPALEGTWVGNFGSRGAAGLALDIAFDPLTYMTLGATGLRVGFKSGTKALTKSGKSRFFALKQEQKALGLVGEAADDAAVAALEKEMVGSAGEILRPDFIDPGGLKFFGATIPATPGLNRRFGTALTNAVKKVPGGEFAIAGAVSAGNALMDMAGGLFSPSGPLRKLPKGMRATAIRLQSKAEKSNVAMKARLHGQASELDKEFRRLVGKKGDPEELGRKMYEWREGTADALTAEEKALAKKVSDLYDSMYFDAYDVGILDEDQLRTGYFLHRYENPPEDFLQVWAGMKGKAGNGESILPKHTKNRVFDTHGGSRGSVAMSQHLHDVSVRMREAGRNVPVYPVLKPDYNIVKNLRFYIDSHVDMVTRKAWHEEAAEIFKIPVDEFDLDYIYDLHKPRLSVVPRGELLREIDELNGLVARSDARPGTTVATRGEPSPIDVDTLTKPGRPAPLSQVEPASSFVHNTLERRAEIKAIREMLKNPNKGLSAAEIKANSELVGEQAGEFARARATRLKAARERLRDLEEAERGSFLETGRALTKEEVPAAKERLAELRARLATPEVSDLHVIDLMFDSGKLKSLRQVEREFVNIPGAKGGKPSKGFADPKVVSEIERTMGNLKTTAGKQELMRQVYLRATSSSQWAGIVKQLSSKWDEFLPDVRAFKPGEVAPSLSFYGEKAAYGVRSGGMWGEKPIFIPEIIAEGIEKANSKLFNSKDYKEFGKLLRGFDRANNWFKLGVYTFWPASAVRDAYSNIALSMLDIGIGALDPKMHLDTVGIMAGRSGKMRDAAGIIHDWTDLRKMAKEMGVWVPGEVFVEATGSGIGIGPGLKKAARLRGLIENEARMQLWLTNIKRGMTAQDSAENVAKFLFDYNSVSQVEREVFRRLIPFYTFTRKNVELQWKMLQRNPGMVINQIKPFRPRNDESEQMVKWEAEGLGIRLDRDGKTVHAIQGIDLPLRNLDTLWAGGVGATGRRIMGMLTPLIKTPIEAVTGRDFFTGGDLKRARGDTLGRILDNKATPRGVKDWLGFKKELDDAGRPRYTFDGVRYSLLVRSWMFSRVFSTTDRQFREYLGDQNTAAALLDFMTGMRSKEINLDEQGQRKLARRIKQLEQSGVRRGIFDEVTIPFQGKGERDLQ